MMLPCMRIEIWNLDHFWCSNSIPYFPSLRDILYFNSAPRWRGIWRFKGRESLAVLQQTSASEISFQRTDYIAHFSASEIEYNGKPGWDEDGYRWWQLTLLGGCKCHDNKVSLLASSHRSLSIITAERLLCSAQFEPHLWMARACAHAQFELFMSQSPGRRLPLSVHLLPCQLSNYKLQITKQYLLWCFLSQLVW